MSVGANKEEVVTREEGVVYLFEVVQESQRQTNCNDVQPLDSESENYVIPQYEYSNHTVDKTLLMSFLLFKKIGSLTITPPTQLFVSAFIYLTKSCSIHRNPLHIHYL
jgi:hypothetical protein